MKDNPSVRPIVRARLASAALALLVLASCTSHPTSGPGSLAACPKPNGISSQGEPIPGDCTLERIGGGVLKLAGLAGKPAVINFWASWCTYCIAEMPAMQKVYAAFGGRVTFVGVNEVGIQGETRGAAVSFAHSTGVRYPLVYDIDGHLFGYFGVRLLLPVTIFVRSDLVVAGRQFGPFTEKTLRVALHDDLGLN